MKTKVVQHVPRIIFSVFKVFKFSGFQVFKNIPGSQILSDIQTFFFRKRLLLLCPPVPRTPQSDGFTSRLVALRVSSRSQEGECIRLSLEILEQQLVVYLPYIGQQNQCSFIVTLACWGAERVQIPPIRQILLYRPWYFDIAEKNMRCNLYEIDWQLLA